MGPDLWELFEDGKEDDEVAAIIRLGHYAVVPKGVRVVTQFNEIITVRMKRGDLLKVSGAPEVDSMVAGDAYLGADLELETAGLPELSSDTILPSDERRPKDVAATGRGVVVGVVDWGFDFAHPDFRNKDGSTRIVALWDQRGSRRPGSPQPFGYGIIRDREAINRALKAKDPYAALDYHPADADTGIGCHGTHVASIAAGSGGEDSPTGIAPEADLVLVHNSPWDESETSKLGDSVTLLEGIDFISRTAGERPWVINLSMGRHGEQHDGSTLIEQGLDAAIRSTPGRAVCLSAGNYYNKKVHASGQLRPTQERTLVWEIVEGKPTYNQMEFWYSWQDKFELAVRSPDGTIAARVKVGERAKFLVGGKEVGNVYHRTQEPNNLDNHITLYLYREAPAGKWEVTLIGTDVIDGRYHAWIERDVTCPRCQSHFHADDADPRSTTGTICNGRRTIAVGAYDYHDPEKRIGPFSSVGPTRDGRLKPDLCAPGVAVLAARSTPRDPQANVPLLTRMNGTSMAAPHVTGTVALIFQAAPRRLRIEETHNLLLQNTRRVPEKVENPDRYGIGFLDIVAVVEAARKIGGTGTSFKQSTVQTPGTVRASPGKSESLEQELLEGEVEQEAFEARAESEFEHEGAGGEFNQNTFHRIANDITSAFEGGKPGTLNLYDRGIISYGKHQATLASGTLYPILKRFTELSSSDTAIKMSSYLDRVKGKDETLREDLEFIRLLKDAAKESTMDRAQDEEFTRQYWEPTKKRAAASNIKTALGHVIFYDTKVQGGLDEVQKKTEARLGGKVGDTVGGKQIGEQESLLTFVDERIQRHLRISANQKKKAGELEKIAQALYEQAAADVGHGGELIGQAAEKRKKAKQYAANAAALEISAKKTRGPSLMALVDSGDLDLYDGEERRIYLKGKPGVAIDSLKPGAAIDVTTPADNPRAPLKPRTQLPGLSAFNTSPQSWFLDEAEIAASRGNVELSRRLSVFSSENLVQPLIDGEELMRALHDDLVRTRTGDFFHFTAWRLNITQDLTPGSTPSATSPSRFDNLLRAAAHRGVGARALIWKAVAAGIHPSSVGGMVSENMHARDWFNAIGGKGVIDGRYPIAGSHHQKSAIVVRDSEAVAYCGGIDVCPDRWDTTRHDSDPRRTREVYAGWHDVHLRLRGPAALDIESNFRDRWNAHEEPSWVPREPVPPPITNPLPPVASAPGTHHVQVLRTFACTHDHYHEFAPRGETTCLAGYLKAISRAQNYIYLEDQYLVSEELAVALDRALDTVLKLIILVPRFTDGYPAEAFNFHQAKFLRIVNARHSGKVHVYHPVQPSTSATIYVHSKLMIIDDVYAVVGSTNVNRRSTTHDTELAAAVVDAEVVDGVCRFARDLRRSLWGEHLNLSPRDRSIADPVLGVAEWERQAAAGTFRVRRHLTPIDRDESPRRWDSVSDPDGRCPRPRVSEAYVASLAQNNLLTEEMESEPVGYETTKLVELADQIVTERARGGASGPILHEMLSRVGLTETLAMRGSDSLLSAAEIFDAFAYPSKGGLREQLEQHFEVVALPQAPMGHELREGDLMMRRGDGDTGYFSVIATPKLRSLEALLSEGMTPESFNNGNFAQVVETGARPHSRSDQFARQLTDSAGRLLNDILLLRLAAPPTVINVQQPSKPATEPGIDTEGSSLAEDFTGADYGEDEFELLHEQLLQERFDPSAIPKNVADVLGKKDWPLALKLAIQAGWRDQNELTDLIFFARHPELLPAKLDPKGPNFKQLSGEWSRILDREVWKAIQASAENTALAVSGEEVADHDRFFWGNSGKRLKELVEDAAKEVDLNPGLLGVIMMAETRRPQSYLSSEKVSSYLIGTDDFYEGRTAIAARVPAYAKVKWDKNQTPFIHYNDARTPREVKDILFDSGPDAVLATAVYVKFREVRLREVAAELKGDFDHLPLETRFALARMAMAAGTAGVTPLLRDALAGKDILIRKAIPVEIYQTQRNATVRTAQAIHLSDWIFGNRLAPASQPEVEESDGWDKTQESAGEGESGGDSEGLEFEDARVEGETDNYDGGSREFPAPPVPAPPVRPGTPECPDDARFRDPLQLPEECLKRLEGTHVAVVGAGLAGLMAARRLRQHRVRVTVFEARHQVGGRVLSNIEFSSGRITEEGAELIGSFHTTWLALAREYGLAVISRMDQDLHYQRAGLSTKLTLDKPLCMNEIIELEKAMNTRVLKPIADYARQIADPSQPWKQETTLKAYDISVADALVKYCKVDKHKDERLWKRIEHLLVNNEVAPLEEMNFLGLLCKVKGGQGPRFGSDPTNLMGYWEELEIFRCADGCQTLARKIAEEIQTDENEKKPKKHPAELRLRTAVTDINLSKQGVALRVKAIKSDGKLADGPPVSIPHRYDYVILAIPPSVWADLKITADGRDAHPKDEIGLMGMGPAVKFFSEVKERFWIKEKAAPFGGSLRLGQVWEGTDNQTRVSKQGIVLSVFAGPVFGGRRVPTPGEFEAGLKLLYPGYARNLNRPPLFSDWPNVPFIKTGYASPRNGQIFTIGKKLSESFRDRMFFAGEHTQMDFFGYMEGALRSGERAAEKLMLQSCDISSYGFV
jgi:phosphatidylserine/phosphatidylglycerophosphate/cardiolipin synthase-like enzyme/monoamine oxidase/subtilisin family serine protease